MRQPIITPAQVGAILKGRRRARRLSQAELAGKLGLSQARLSVLEADPSSLSVERLLLLAKLLGLELILQDKAEEPAPKAQW